MMYVNNQLCYSPLHPAQYGGSMIGHGPMCQGDVQLWNLIYMSAPDVDRYIEVGAKPAKVFKSISKDIWVTCKTLLYGESTQKFFPNVRAALKETPREFYERLLGMDWKHMPPTMRIHDWIHIVGDRVAEIEELYAPIHPQTLMLIENMKKGAIT